MDMKNSCTRPHMEGIDATAKAFGLSAYQVRKLARSPRGAAFTVKIGNRYLINQEKFAAFLNCELAPPEMAAPAQDMGVIRPIPVNL